MHKLGIHKAGGRGWYLYEMMDINYTYCGNHFMIYGSQIIMLCISNLYSVVYQLYLNKTHHPFNLGLNATLCTTLNESLNPAT